MSREWVQPGASAFLLHSRSYCTPVTIDRLTKTLIVLSDGSRYRKDDMREVGQDVYHSDLLISADDPRVARAQEAMRVQALRNAALAAVNDFRVNAGDSKAKARVAAAALLAYADGGGA